MRGQPYSKIGPKKVSFFPSFFFPAGLLGGFLPSERGWAVSFVPQQCRVKRTLPSRVINPTEAAKNAPNLSRDPSRRPGVSDQDPGRGLLEVDHRLSSRSQHSLSEFFVSENRGLKKSRGIGRSSARCLSPRRPPGLHKTSPICQTLWLKSRVSN